MADDKEKNLEELSNFADDVFEIEEFLAFLNRTYGIVLCEWKDGDPELDLRKAYYPTKIDVTKMVAEFKGIRLK